MRFAPTVIAVLVPVAAAAQVTVGPNVQMTRARGEIAQFELLGSADPTNPDRLLSCVIEIDQQESRDTTYLYQSTDGGKTWAPTLDTRKYKRSGDPVCSFTPTGTALYSALALREGERPNYTLMYRSTDGGATWSDPQHLPIIDRQYIVADSTKGKYQGRVYLHGTGSTRGLDGPARKNGIHLFTSRDDGKTWMGPVVRASLGDGWVLGTAPGVVLSDGTLALLAGEVQQYSQPTGARIDKPEANRPNSKLKLLTSKDGGETFEDPTTVGDWYFQWPPTSICCVPSLAVDATAGPFKDRLYAAWSDLRSGRSEILFSQSGDKGKTWSRPVAVNDDASPRDRRDHFKPIVEVNKDGVVGVMWHDRRDAADNLGWTIRFAASTDGGDTFSPSVAVSTAPQKFGGEERWVVSGSASGGGGEVAGEKISIGISLNGFTFNGGHTVAMPAASGGAFHPMWVDNRTGVPQAWTAAVTVKGAAVRHGDPTLASLEDVTKKVAVELRGLSYDRKTNVVSATVHVKNTSKEVLKGPIKLRIVSLQSDVARAALLEGDKAIEAEGAVIDFTPLLKEGTLAPDAMSDGKALRFRLTDLQPFIEDGKMRFGLIRLDARVLAPKPPGDDTKKTP